MISKRQVPLQSKPRIGIEQPGKLRVLEVVGPSADHASLPLPNYRAVMPTFRGQVTEEQVLQLIAYVKSLSSAERTPAP